MRRGAACVTLAVVLKATTAPAQGGPMTPAHTTPFYQGRVRLALGLGIDASGAGDSRFAVSGGFGYFVLDGLEIGVDGSTWLGGGATVGNLGPQARYILHMVPGLQPYLGVFYRHWFLGDDAFPALGGRAGVFYVGGGRLFVALGIAHEVPLDEAYSPRTVPELTISVSF